MEKKQPTTLLAAFKFITGLSFFAFLFWVCNAQDKKKVEPEAISPGQIKLNCVILQRSQMQRWVDSGWTNPAKPDSLIKKIMVQFYSPDAKSAAENMQLISYPAATYLKVYPTGKENTTIDSSCVALIPAGKTILSNNYFKLADLDIFDNNGKLKTDFTFLRFRPVQNRNEYGDYVTFEWQVVRVDQNNQQSILKTGSTSDPCPTFCEEEGGQ